jgi:hypothetical protein
MAVEGGFSEVRGEASHRDSGRSKLARNDALSAHAGNGVDFDEDGLGAV